MADTVTRKVLEDGPRNYILAVHNNSDGTGEALSVLVDNTTFSGYNAISNNSKNFKIESLYFSTTGNMGFKLFWEGTPNALAWSVPPNYFDNVDFKSIGGLQNEAATPTGRLLLSTYGAAVNSSYNTILRVKKT